MRKILKWAFMAHLAACAAGTAAVVFAVMMVLQRSLYSAAMCLMVVLLQTGALIYLAGAPLLGFLQVMIYAGAVMVLVVMTILAAPRAAGERWAPMRIPKPLAVVLLAVLALEFAGLGAGAPARGQTAQAFAAQARLGVTLFGPYAVATEAVGFLLLLAALALPLRRPAPPVTERSEEMVASIAVRRQP